MAVALQGVQGDARLNDVPPRTAGGVRLFGIRHLSPAGAWHLTRFLDEVRPELVLIESPADASPLIEELTRPGVTPPVAILCYTAEVPVHSLVYPLAAYSPEYQAMRWAADNRCACRFIDLPSHIKSPLYLLLDRERAQLAAGRTEAGARQESGGEGEIPEKIRLRMEYDDAQRALYARVAELSGERDFDAYWERRFEHNLEQGAYLRSVALHSSELRALSQGQELEADPLSAAINVLREGYMKRQICEAVEGGIPADKIVVVCGAYHLSGLAENAPMSDAELAALPTAATRMTLMPYSYYKLSSFSGYGAGNHAPYYFEMMWDAMERGALDTLPAVYMSALNRHYRERHGYASTANVIEAVRLARSLQYLHGGLLPTLSDLHDSAVSAMAGGEVSALSECFARLDVGTRIGSLPDGVSQTPIQDDMNRQLKRLGLSRYKSVVAESLALDLRENRRVKSGEAAFIDLERSIFLHRLELIGTGFATPVRAKQEGATWAEQWTLCWTPEVEMRLVESVLYGDTIEAAAAYTLRERLEKADDVDAVAQLVRAACLCRLPDSVADALARLQDLSSESESFHAVARAAREMSFLVQYGSVRRFDEEPLKPVLVQLFLKAALLLLPSASCDDDTARAAADEMTRMHHISQEHDALVHDDIWLAQLNLLATSGEKNPLLCGFAFSILLERGQVDEGRLSAEVSRQLSPGNTPEAGGAWFEGLSRRNRYALLSRPMLWRELDGYLRELDDGGFKRALVCLRRAFSAFEPHEKSGVCDILAELWQVETGSVAELISGELSEAEAQSIDGLADFDFGDLV